MSIDENLFRKKLSPRRVIKMTQEKLVRGIGRGDLIAICINTIIGAGIFGVPSQIQALI